MQSLRILSASEQVAQHLRGELRRKTWSELMPGARTLTSQLGANHKTVEAALAQLEREGVLKGRGPGRRRRIVPPAEVDGAAALRIGILLFEPSSRKLEYFVELRHSLQDAGHLVIYTPKTTRELNGDLGRIRRMVDQCNVDAWLIPAGSREVLEWFAARPLPVFALAGRIRGLPIPSIAPEKVSAMRSAVRQMVEFGHRRIVLLTREGRRKPEPGYFERCFVNELERHGIETGGYNLPDWDESTAGFHAGLESLFRVSPPTAVIIDEAVFVGAFLQFCAERGLAVPRDVSLCCTDPDPSFEWFQPAVAHIGWDSRPFVRRIVRWARNVSLGKEDRRRSMSAAKLVPGGTIGPAPASTRTKIN